MIIRVEQRMGIPRIKITITMIWLWITHLTSCPHWQASWPAFLQSPRLKPNLPCLQEQSLLLMRSLSSSSSPTLPQLPWLLQPVWPMPPPLPQSPQSLELLHTVIAAQEEDHAVSTVGAPAPLVFPTVNPVHLPQACQPRSKTHTCCITASTVTSTFLTTSFTPSTWAAMATRTHSSATSAATSARASMTLPATLPVGSTSN